MRNVPFIYHVQIGDSDPDGISIAADAIDLNGGSILDDAGNDADLSHDAVPANTGHKVDAPGGL